MATASTSTLPLSPAFSTAHFQWPPHPHPHHFPAPSHYHRLSDHSLHSFDLPDLSSSFGHSSHAVVFPAAAGLSSPDSPDAEAEGTSPYFSTAAHFPSLSSLSSSPSSSSSTVSPAPSPPAISLPARRQQQGNSRRKRRQADDADEAAEERQSQQQQSHADPDTDDDTVRRLKHRQIDAARRAREQSAISRLQQLTQRLTHIAHFDHLHDTPAKRRRTAAESKKDKVSVLEEAADRMDALYGLIEQLGEACMSQYDQHRSAAYQHKSFSTQDKSDARESRMLKLLPSHSIDSHTARAQSQRIEAAAITATTNTTGRHSLYSTFFLSASLPMLTVRCDTGAVLDINSAVLALSGWQAHHLIGKRITAPYSHVMSSPPKTYEELNAELWCPPNDHDRVMVEEKDGRMVNAKEHRQYQTSHDMERKLYGGELSVIQAVWRLQLRNGRLHEMTATQWCGEWHEVPDGSGGMRRQPTYVVYVISPESIIRVD